MVTDFIFLSYKINTDADCGHKIKRRLLLGRKATTNLDSILKSRDITFLTKVHAVKAMDFPLVMYGCQSWTIKKAEHWRTDTFKLLCWRRLLRVSWIAKASRQTILKEINFEYSLKGWCCKWSFNILATWYEDLIHWKCPWCWERLKAGGEGDIWLTSLSQWVWASSERLWKTGKPGVLQSMGSQRVSHNRATEQQYQQQM